MTATIKYVSTVDSRLSQLKIEDCQLIFVNDTRKIYLDFNGVRTEYSQIIPLATENDRLNYLAPIGGFYFVKETKILWCYEGGEWVQLTSAPKEHIVFINYENLPQTGEKGVLYIVEDQISSYIWNESEYIKMGDPVWESI